MITFDKAETMMRTARNGSRKLGNNTYLHGSGDTYSVRYHSTDIVAIHRDGTYTLRTGGWETSTTKTRLNEYSPARVYSEGGVWAIWRDDDPKTAPKMRPCRKCRGAGRVHQVGWRHYYDYDASGHYRRTFPPVIVMPRYAECSNCGGSGRRDYGSKTMPVVFFSGIVVDSDGRVLNADHAARLREPIEVTIARTAKAGKAARAAWLKDRGLPVRAGTVIMFKAVRDDGRSYHGMRYAVGSTVTAGDYAPAAECGQGLHFSPTVGEARSYDGQATRFLACAVDVRTMIPLGDDKVKARSCRVLHEVDENHRKISA